MVEVVGRHQAADLVFFPGKAEFEVGLRLHRTALHRTARNYCHERWMRAEEEAESVLDVGGAKQQRPTMRSRCDAQLDNPTGVFTFI